MNQPNMKPKSKLPKLDFLVSSNMFILGPMSFSPLSLVEKYISVLFSGRKLVKRLGSFAWNLRFFNKTFLETFLAYSSLKSEVFVVWQSFWGVLYGGLLVPNRAWFFKLFYFYLFLHLIFCSVPYTIYYLSFTFHFSFLQEKSNELLEWVDCSLKSLKKCQ